MPPPQQQYQASDLGVVWVVIGIFALFTGIWFFGHTYVVSAFFFLKRMEISFLQFFTGWFTGLGEIKRFIAETPPGSVSFKMMTFVATGVGSYLRYPVAAITILMGFILLSKNVVSKYSRTYTMDSLLQSETQVWPYTKIVKDLNLIDQDIHEGPWAIALTPVEFAKKYKLLKKTLIKPKTATLSKEVKVVMTVLKSRAARNFVMQLGKPWEGVDALNDHTKALYAVFVAKAARDSDRADKLLHQFAFSIAEGQLDLSSVDETLTKYKDYPAVVEITSKHAYVLTVMASMLQLARSDGVLSSAEFLWLKSVDRRLWFMLNAVGRQTAVVEVGGPFAHWLAEKEIGRRLKTPMIDQAVKGLDVAIQEMRYGVED